MKKIAFIAASVIMLACGEKKSSPETVTVADEMAEKASQKVYNSAEREAKFTSDQVAAFYDAYNDLKTALVNSDSQMAREAAVLLKTTLEGVETGAPLEEAVSAIAGSDDLEKQREYFEAVTAGVKTVVENNITEGTLYYQYCPMAFNGKGAYWISNEEKVFNPYFGDKMLKCGTVDQKIN